MDFSNLDKLANDAYKNAQEVTTNLEEAGVAKENIPVLPEVHAEESLEAYVEYGKAIDSFLQTVQEVGEEADVDTSDLEEATAFFDGLEEITDLDEEWQGAVIAFLEEEDFAPDDITINEGAGYTGSALEIEVGNKTWLLFLNSDDAEEEAKADVRSLIDEMGVGAFNENFWPSHVDEGRLAEDYSSGEFDAAYDEPDSWLYDEEPDGEDGDWSDEQREKAGEMAKERVEEDPVGYLSDIYGSGSEELNEILSRYVDEESMVQEAVDTDGVAHFLGRYDGNVIELGDDAEAYRQN